MERTEEKKDMYGHEITPIEGGYGVSVTFHGREGEMVPEFTFFHESDGFHQGLFNVSFRPPTELDDPLVARPYISNIAYERVNEIFVGGVH